MNDMSSASGLCYSAITRLLGTTILKLLQATRGGTYRCLRLSFILWFGVGKLSWFNCPASIIEVAKSQTGVYDVQSALKAT